jgi:hypothetical protein
VVCSLGAAGRVTAAVFIKGVTQAPLAQVLEIVQGLEEKDRSPYPEIIELAACARRAVGPARSGIR